MAGPRQHCNSRIDRAPKAWGKGSRRARRAGLARTLWVTAGLGGPVVGGILTEHFHWSIIFWFNVPLGLVAAIMAHRSLKGLPRHDRKHKLDLLGAGLMAASAIPLLLALTWGGSRYPWLSAPIAALVLAAAVLSSLFTASGARLGMS